MKNILLILIILGVAMGGLWFYFNNPTFLSEKEIGLIMTPKPTLSITPFSGDEATDATGSKWSGAILAGSESLLLEYNTSDYDVALNSGKLIVLYFYANWCPLCKAEFPKMEQAFNDLTTDQVVGFRVNYNDNETDNDEKYLARQHGVAYQHTKVFVKNGQRIGKWPDSWGKDRYLAEISKFIGQ